MLGAMRLIICFAAALVLAPSIAAAHSLSVAHVQLLETGKGHRLEIDLSIRDLALTFPLDIDRDDMVTWGELQAARPAIEAMVTRDLQVSNPQAGCLLEPSGYGVRNYEGGAYASLSFNVQCSGAGPSGLNYNIFFDRDPSHRAILTIQDGSQVRTTIATSTQRSVGGSTSWVTTFVQFFREGVHHILIGYDHIAFLILLLLPVVLVRSGATWKPDSKTAGTIWRAAGIVTAFTLAHSITLGLAALGFVRPASTWVEAAIALSVLLAAINNVFPVVTQRAWQLAIGFGLIHGFGFAGALEELGLPQGERLLALVSFNLGVEAGQLAIVLMVLPLLLAMRKHGWYSRIVMPAISLLVGIIAIWWLVERTIFQT